MFVKSEDGKRWLWLSKPKSKSEVIGHTPNSPARVKTLNRDHEAAEIARRTPTSGKQTILMENPHSTFGGGTVARRSKGK